jgi:streptogramin lyase
VNAAFDARRGLVIYVTPDGSVYYASLAATTLAHRSIDERGDDP